MELQILGSVAPFCSLDKNCSGFLVTDGLNKILLDYGPGVTRLMDMEKTLKNLTCFITHLHKDHYGGLLELGPAAYVYHNLGYLNKKIDIYTPYTDKIDYNYLASGEEQYFNINNYSETNKFKIGDIKISFRKTKHNITNYAIKLEKDNYELCYSGDTGYDENLCTFFSNANLLICESTFIKGQHRNGNNHLYAHEAAQLAKLSNVKQLMLTHFWPTIDKELYRKEALEIFENTIVAEESKKLILK